MMIWSQSEARGVDLVGHCVIKMLLHLESPITVPTTRCEHQTLNESPITVRTTLCENQALNESPIKLCYTDVVAQESPIKLNYIDVVTVEFVLSPDRLEQCIYGRQLYKLVSNACWICVQCTLDLESNLPLV